MDNTSGREDQDIRKAEGIADIVQGLLDIIDRLDSELTSARDEIEDLKQ